MNHNYGALSDSAKTAVRSQLQKDQRDLCAYTGHNINSGDFHIEHLKPRTCCKPGEDVGYGNLVAAYNKRADVPYGAPAKADWHEPDRFVSPLDPNCESRFDFDQFGKIRATDANDQAALTTIDRLQLDHQRLTDLRQAQIEEWLFGDEPIEQILSLLAHSSRYSDEPLVEFEFAIRSAARAIVAR